MTFGQRCRYGIDPTGGVTLTSGSPARQDGDKAGQGTSITLPRVFGHGFGRADLTFGADGEDAGDGVLLHPPSNSTGLGYADSVIFGKPTPGTPTDARAGRTLTP